MLADVDTAPADGAPAAHTVPRPPLRRTAAAITLAVPACGLVIYLWLGSPQALDPRAQSPRIAAGGIEPAQPGGTAGPARPSGATAGDGPAPDVEAMVDSLAAKLAADPANAEGWLLLARSRVVQERFDEAITAYERAHALLGDSPSLLADWAEADAALAGNRFPARALGRLDRALEIDPGHEKALWLGGFAAIQHGRPDVARARWERLLARQAPESRERPSSPKLLARVDGAAPADAPSAARPEATGSAESTESAGATDSGGSADAGKSAGPAESAGATDSGGPADAGKSAGTRRIGRGRGFRRIGECREIRGTRRIGRGRGLRRTGGCREIRGTRRIDRGRGFRRTGRRAADRRRSQLGARPRGELGGGEPVFVFARAPSGSGPPAAVARTTVAALPVTIVLDASSAMVASRSLASIEHAVVTARVARSGTVTRTSGDVEGVPNPSRSPAPRRCASCSRGSFRDRAAPRREPGR